MNIAAFSDSKDNNLNLIRLICAWLVIFSHSYPLALGTGVPGDPLSRITNMTFGSLGVDIFFLISGFLIFRSAMLGNSLLSFTVARTLRIMPALIVVVLMTTFMLGPWLTRLPLADYLAHPQTWWYMQEVLWVMDGAVAYELPGVFKDNPYPGSVNGSLWTLPIEAWMYAAVAAFVWGSIVLYRLTDKEVLKAPLLLLTVLTILACYKVPATLLQELHPNMPKILYLSAVFLVGSCFYAFRRYIPLSLWLLIPMWLVHPLMTQVVVYKVYLVVAIAYTILYLAYVPAGPVRKFNQLGDYSYGLYIFAFPIQQTLAHFYTLNVLEMTVWSTLLTLVMAVISWHCIEAPAMKLKQPVLAFCRLGWLRERVSAKSSVPVG